MSAGSTIVGYGHYVPERRVGNAEIEARFPLLVRPDSVAWSECYAY